MLIPHTDTHIHDGNTGWWWQISGSKLFYWTYLHNVGVCTGFLRLIVLGVLEQDLVHVRAGVLEKLVVAAEDNQGNFTVAQHR